MATLNKKLEDVATKVEAPEVSEETVTATVSAPKSAL